MSRRSEGQEARNPKSATGSMTLDPRMVIHITSRLATWKPPERQLEYIWNHEVEPDAAPRVLEAEDSRSVSIVRGLINPISHWKLGDGCHLMGFHGVNEPMTPRQLDVRHFGVIRSLKIQPLERSEAI